MIKEWKEIERQKKIVISKIFSKLDWDKVSLLSLSRDNVACIDEELEGAINNFIIYEIFEMKSILLPNE